MKAESFHIKTKIESFGEGHVFSYQDLGQSDESTRKMVSRMIGENKLVSLRNGLFLKPRYNKFLKKNLSADQTEIMNALLRKEDILPADHTLFYQLNLTPQVPMRQAFLINSESREIKIADDLFYFIKSPFLINRKNKKIVTILYCLRNIGKIFESKIEDQILKTKSLIFNLNKSQVKQLVNLSVSKDKVVYSALLGALLCEIPEKCPETVTSLLRDKIKTKISKLNFNAKKYLIHASDWGLIE